jgi:cytochrome c
VGFRKVWLVPALAGLLGAVLMATPAQAASAYAWLSPNSAHTKCLDDPNFATGNNVVIDQWSCVAQSNENWRFEGSGSDLSARWVRNQWSNKCLTVLGGSTKRGAFIVQYTCTTVNSNGEWYIEYGNRAGIMLQNKHSNLCLNVEGAFTNNGARLIQWDCDPDALNENFTFFASPFG